MRQNLTVLAVTLLLLARLAQAAEVPARTTTVPGLPAAVSSARPDDGRKESFTDSFDSAGSTMWQPFPSAAKVDGGVVTITPPEGQQWLASASRFQYGELEMTVRFNRLSDNSTLFYYLGFQNLMPWARQVCWLQVQDAQMNIVVSKDGVNTINVPVVSGLKTDQKYRLKLQWTAAAIVVLVDGRVVSASNDERHGLSSAGRAAEIVPIAPMHVFLAANTLDNKKGLASLTIDEVRLSGGRPARVSRPPVTNHTARLDRNRSVGSPDRVTAELRDGRIRLENAGLVCEWDAAAGLAWRQLVHKPKGVALLYESDNSPLFIVLGKDFYCDSRDCIIEDVRIQDGDVRQSVALSLRHPESGLTFVLGASLAASEDVRMWLRVRNDGAAERRLQTIFPIVGRVRTDGDRNGLRYFYPWRSGIAGAVDAYLMNEYGNLAWMQVMCAFDPASGAAVSLYPRDRTGVVKGLVLKKQSPEPGPMVRHCEVILQEEVPSVEPLDFEQGLGMAVYALPKTVPVGADIALPESSLSVYVGDWKAAIHDYARWLHTWYRPVGAPAWFRDSFGFTPVHPPDFYSYEQNKYIGAERLRGSDHILQWSYWDDDELNIAFPCYNPAHRHYREGDWPVSTPLLARHVTAARDAMRRENPEAILMTEHAGSDYMSQFVDGSWVQTYHRDGFPFAEKYFDAESLHYFRFVCPEFKLAEWGANNDGARRCLFNGIGFIGHDYGGAADVLQTLRENGDAFATLQPEPHVTTLVTGLLANRFPVDGKLVYTLYNKSGAPVTGEAIEVEALPDWHWVECLSDVEAAVQPGREGRQRLSLNLDTGSTACVSRLGRLLSAEKTAAGAVLVSVLRGAPNTRLVACLDKDTGLPADGREVRLREGKTVVDVDQLFGRRGKLILKLLHGTYLVDEAIIAL